ncbi:hypothetical protein OIU79_023778 [Salix purpurea]|uniref:Uncharacterized protein n=1 Tax=Salix purpurea TaxID=77065 RepID=A0A9Q0WCA9_SALPP|nr:hypothetical protein OIU79_023778 [Salix purpurea]
MATANVNLCPWITMWAHVVVGRLNKAKPLKAFASNLESPGLQKRDLVRASQISLSLFNHSGYFAWRTVRSSPEIDGFVSDDSNAEKTPLREKQELNFKRVIQNGFWVFVDMASGRYLWRNFKEMKKDETLKSL